MSDHWLDRQFRSALRGKSAQVPEGMWEAVQAGLPPDGRNRRHWMVFWIAGALLLAVILGVAFSNNVFSSIQAKSTPPEDISNVENVIPIKESAVARSAKMATPDRKNNLHPVAPNQVKQQHSAAGNDEKSTESGSEKAELTWAEVNFETKSAVQTSTSESRHAEKRHITNILLNNLPGRQTTLEVFKTFPDEFTDCYNFGGRTPGNFFVEAYTGPSFPTRILRSRDELVTDYIGARDSTESTGLSWHAGLRVGYQHPMGFNARVGAHYTYVHEVFDYSAQQSRQVIVLDTTFFPDTVIIHRDTVLQSGTRVIETHNRFHTVDIPLLVGYQIQNGDWEYGLLAGPVFNVVFRKRGTILSPALIPASFSDPQAMEYNPTFEDNLGLSVYGAGHIARRIGEKLYLYAEPHVHHRLKSITLEGYPIDQRQTLFGLSLGLKMNL